MEKLELLYIVGENLNGTEAVRKSFTVFQNVKHRHAI